MKAFQVRAKSLHKGAVENISVWKLVSKDGKILCDGFVLFRNITPKEKSSGNYDPKRKNIAALKFKRKFVGDEVLFYVGDDEIEEAEKFVTFLDDLQK